jgi:hypothetical protein
MEGMKKAKGNRQKAKGLKYQMACFFPLASWLMAHGFCLMAFASSTTLRIN